MLDQQKMVVEKVEWDSVVGVGDGIDREGCSVRDSRSSGLGDVVPS